MPRLHGKAQVFLHGEAAEQVGDLERASDTGACEVFRRKSGHRLPGDRDEAGVGREHA